MKLTKEEKILLDAYNKTIQKKRRFRLVERWVPPTCAVPGCGQSTHLRERDYEPGRDYFCSRACFERVRLYNHQVGDPRKLPILPPVEWEPAPEARGRKPRKVTGD